MNQPITKTAATDQEHFCEYLVHHGRIVSHVPGIAITVKWSAGRAAETRIAFERAVAEIRGQLVDGQEG